MLHFDSYHGNYTTSPYNCSWNLVQPLYGITSIGIVSIEIINSFNNVRVKNNTNSITVFNGATPYTITLTLTIYTDISILLKDINSAFSTLNSSLGIVFSLITIGGYSKVSVKATNFVPTMGYSESNLPYVLGFKQGLDSITTVLTAYTGYNLGHDTIFYMNLLEPSSENNSNNLFSSFKILLSVSSNSVQYSTGNITINQSVRTNPKQAISKIAINLIDRFGFDLPSENSLDYSFTLAFNRN